MQPPAVEVDADAVADVQLDHSRELRDEGLSAHVEMDQGLGAERLHDANRRIAHALLHGAQAHVLRPHAEQDLPLVVLQRDRHRQASAIDDARPPPLPFTARASLAA